MELTDLQIAGLVSAMFVGTGQTRPTKSQLEVWGDAVKHLDWSVATLAARELIATEERPPSIATFFRYVERHFAGTVPSAEDAITEVLRQISLVGRSATPEWTHAAIGRAVDSIGWRDICASENDYWKTQFMKAYANISKRCVTEDRLEITSGRAALDTSELFAIGEA